MIIDCHGHVSAPTELWAYKASILSHRGCHGPGKVLVSDDDLVAAMHKKEMAPTGHLHMMERAGTSSQCNCSTVSVGTVCAAGQMNRSFSRRFISSQKPLRSHPRIFTRLRLRLPNNVHACGERIEAQGPLHQQRQTVDVQAKVDRLAVQVHLQGFVETKHRSLPSASTRRATCSQSQPRRSTTKPLGRRACRSSAGSAGAVGVASTVTGTIACVGI
jgi:hypothetical protein